MTITIVLLMCVVAMFLIGSRITSKHPLTGAALLVLTGVLVSALLRHFGFFP
jgi:hypothetical protein